MNSASCWAILIGQAIEPTACQLIPPPPCRLKSSVAGDIHVGAAFGPMTHAEAVAFAGFGSSLQGTTTLCIVLSDGLQAIHLDGLALQKAMEALDGPLPGMTFFLEDGGGILLVGYGERFADIRTTDVTASCGPHIAFPVGRVWAAPECHATGQWLRERTKEHWTPPVMTTLEDLAPLARFLAGLNLTGQDRALFAAAEQAQCQRMKDKPSVLTPPSALAPPGKRRRLLP